MINQFKDPQILEYPLKFTYINEQGSDAAGISRDVYATFWTELLDHAAEGEELRVPLLTPKWQEEEWKSIARILVKGFKDHSYFPCRLAPVFAVTVIFALGEIHPMLRVMRPQVRPPALNALIMVAGAMYETVIAIASSSSPVQEFLHFGYFYIFSAKV
ncbi:hypothetical protein WMY93_026161 [Mugilogobius chulae]|uniref:Uncharacterized protein n=1 Tax=Mugilogobius chulae TaxID=88201 RepID=A0AAW0N2E2_9GOBI